MSFKIGDYVKYISKCVDHQGSWLKLGEVYKICAVEDKSVQLEARSPSQNDHGFAWWVQLDNVVLVNYTKKELICEKVREMDSRFKKKQKQKTNPIFRPEWFQPSPGSVVEVTSASLDEFITWVSERQEEDTNYALAS